MTPVAGEERAVSQILTDGGIRDPEMKARLIIEAAADPAAALDMARRRVAGEPLAYVLGRSSFMGAELFAGPGALAPRHETELLGWTAARILNQRPEPRLYVVDMCCGSGNLACGIALAEARADVWASDVTEGSVLLARRNVDRLGLSARVQVVLGDLFAPLAGRGLEGTMHAVICNPPYISTSKLGKDSAGLLNHEPREAFDGGAYGISIHQRVVREAPGFLVPGGCLCFEIGVGQSRQVMALLGRSKAYDEIELVNDEFDEPRVAIARRRSV